jgi:hypothetical protein
MPFPLLSVENYTHRIIFASPDIFITSKIQGARLADSVVAASERFGADAL